MAQLCGCYIYSASTNIFACNSPNNPSCLGLFLVFEASMIAEQQLPIADIQATSLQVGFSSSATQRSL